MNATSPAPCGDLRMKRMRPFAGKRKQILCTRSRTQNQAARARDAAVERQGSDNLEFEEERVPRRAGARVGVLKLRANR